MVNASNLAAAAGAAAGALSGASAGVELGTASVRRTAVRKAAAASPQQASGIGTFLLGFLARRELAATAGGGVMKARGRSAVVPGYAGASGAPRGAASASPSSATSRPATSKAATSTSTSKSSSSLSFLSDPKLSIEEKLMRLMAYLNDKYEKEMQAKMDEIAGKKTASSSSSSTQKKSSGFLGKIAGAVSSVFGDGALGAVKGFMSFPGVKTTLKHVAGPVLAAGATALGFPEAAPLLLKYGSNVVDAVASVASASSSGGSSGTSSSGGTTTSTSGTDGKTDQLAMMEIQRLMDKQKEMFSLVSNILKAGHDTRMAAINNVR